MIKQENPNFVASFYAPNPMEVTYWIDLSTDANGNVIKVIQAMTGYRLITLLILIRVQK